MARVTVEDCIQIVSNRFELVLVAGQRAREISSGAPLTLERDNDKNAVVALREIAQHNVDPVILRESVIRGLQKLGKFDSHEEHIDEEDNMNIMEMEMMEDASSLTIEEDLPDDADMSFGDDDLTLDD